MASYTSTGSGIWDNVATWGGGGFPVAGDSATIANTHTVTLDSDEQCDDLDVQAGGTLALATHRLIHTGNVTFGTTSDVTGSGELRSQTDGTSNTYTNNKSGTFSFTGKITARLIGPNRMVITGDWRNANYSLISDSSANRNFLISSGTIRCIDFEVTSGSTGNATVNCDTNNPSFIISGNVDLNAGAGSYTTIWTKGTGGITLGGGAANIALDGQTIEDLTVNATGAKTLTENAGTADSLTVTANTIDLGVYNLTTSGGTNVTGTLKIGVSAGTGLVCAGLSINSGSGFNLQKTSVISNSGNYACHNSSVFTTNNTGKYTQTQSANYTSPSSSNKWEDFTQNAGITTTLTADADITDNNSDDTVINGTIATAGYEATIGNDTAGSITLGVNCDVSGAGSFTLISDSSGTLTNNKATKFSITGTVRHYLSGASINTITGDFSDAEYELLSWNAGNFNAIPISGTIKCQDLDFEQNGAGNIVLVGSTNNPNWEINGSVNLNNGGGAGTGQWTAGSGTILLNASSGTESLDWNAQTIENTTHNHSGATYEYAGNVTIATCTFSNGTVQSTVGGTQRTITVTNTSVAANTTFKDISMGSANRVNAKAATNTNSGNCLGIVFNDTVR
jgi:hypothetical protein